jgi:hypothetical protein
LNNSGFEVQRSRNNDKFKVIAFIPGFGTTAESKEYSYTDENVSGHLKYRLKQIDFDGSYEFSKIVEVNSLPILSFELKQNYPNPFNPITTITFTLPADNDVKLIVLNSIGEVVEILVDELQTEGKYEVVWNAEGFPSGVYFYKLETNDFVDIKKMILLR